MPKKRTRKMTLDKPEKPHPDFPLFPHSTGRWAKKVRGRLVYLGPWDAPQASLERWLAQKDDLLADRTPRPQGGELTLKDFVMGHENGADMPVHYRERIGDDRLRAVADHVRTWLFGRTG